jgi:hypothetical protein
MLLFLHNLLNVPVQIANKTGLQKNYVWFNKGNTHGACELRNRCFIWLSVDILHSARTKALAATRWLLRLYSSVTLCYSWWILDQDFIRLSSIFPAWNLSVIVPHRLLMYVITLTRQHINTSSVFKLGEGGLHLRPCTWLVPD